MPVVGSNIPGLRDSIQNRKNGFLVPKNNVQIFVDSILSLRFTDLYTRFSENSIKFAVDNFEEKIVIRNLLEAIEQV